MTMRTCPRCGGFFEGVGHCCDDCKAPRQNYKRPPRGTALSPREKQLVTLVATGKTNKEIANDLLLCEGTIKVYLSKIFMKMGVANRTELAIRVLNEKALEDRIAQATENAIKMKLPENLPPSTVAKILDCVGVDPHDGKGKVVLP